MRPRRIPALLLLVIVAVAAAAAATAASRPTPPSRPRVVGFWLVDVATGAWRRRLTDGATIREPPGTYTIAAVSSAGRRRPVVFVAPASYARTEREAPYVAAGDVGGVVKGMALPAGPVTVSAYVAAAAGGGGDAAPRHNGAAGHWAARHAHAVPHSCGGYADANADVNADTDAHDVARHRRAVRVAVADAGHHAGARRDGATLWRRG